MLQFSVPQTELREMLLSLVLVNIPDKIFNSNKISPSSVTTCPITGMYFTPYSTEHSVPTRHEKS